MVTAMTYRLEIHSKEKLDHLYRKGKNIHGNQSNKEFVLKLFLSVDFDDSFLALII